MKDKKNRTEKEEERGAKRSFDDWEEFAKRLKTNAEERVEGSKNSGEGMYINQSHVAQEIGAVSMGESDVEFDESVFEFINSTWKEYEEELYHDAISGELMIKELVEAARKVEMETFKKHGVYEKVPIEECWKETGKALVGVKWVDTNMGDKEKPEYRCRLVVCGDPAAGGQKDDVLVVGQCAWNVFRLWRCSSCIIPREGEKKSIRGAVKRRFRGGQVQIVEKGHVWHP